MPDINRTVSFWVLFCSSFILLIWKAVTIHNLGRKHALRMTQVVIWGGLNQNGNTSLQESCKEQKKSNSAIRKLFPKPITLMESSCLWFRKAQNCDFKSETPLQYLTKRNNTLDEKRCFLLLHTSATQTISTYFGLWILKFMTLRSQSSHSSGYVC